MKVQTYEEMIQAGATENEALCAIEFFRVFRPALKVKRSNGRIETTHGDKNILGLYRTARDLTRAARIPSGKDGV